MHGEYSCNVGALVKIATLGEGMNRQGQDTGADGVIKGRGRVPNSVRHLKLSVTKDAKKVRSPPG
ncbi:MAG: hypothetical protein BRC53_05225 [Cyanobacteria bacterium SW_6_48_11]|nr:MAG: hypothetical protein BRC53_05225 [Cyanobacteria bacterium SW_6_48_11]